MVNMSSLPAADTAIEPPTHSNAASRTKACNSTEPWRCQFLCPKTLTVHRKGNPVAAEVEVEKKQAFS
jgi:hypothetical protein